MTRLPWTKFQDFYLRLGFLKWLVVVLSPNRRSEANEVIVKKLMTPMFESLEKYPVLAARVRSRLPEKRRRKTPASAGKHDDGPSIAEALIVDGDCPSYLSAVTGPTAYKILDWGRNVGFLVRGNQISERGLLLRMLFEPDRVDGFLGGDVAAWNPFVLSFEEKMFLSYHLFEIDGVMLELTRFLGRYPAGSTLEGKLAAEATSEALIRVLATVKNTVQGRDILAFRTACDLAITIANEVGQLHVAEEMIGRSRPKAIPSRRLVRTSDGKEARLAHKNADHQTIPRFEQLADLGFVDKLFQNEEAVSLDAAKRKWRYRTTEASVRWAQALSDLENTERPFLWHGFSAAFLRMASVDRTRRADSTVELASYFWKAYQLVRRPAGYDPLDSVALIAMIMAAKDGLRIEMSEFHLLMLQIKQKSLLPTTAYFASGNDLDRMFILLKPGFVGEIEKVNLTLSDGGINVD